MRGMTGYVDVRDVCELMIRLCEDPLVSGERFVLNGGNYTYQELFTAIARVNGVQPPWWNLAPWMTELVWRMLACWGYLSGSKPAFTRETARSSFTLFTIFERQDTQPLSGFSFLSSGRDGRSYAADVDFSICRSEA